MKYLLDTNAAIALQKRDARMIKFLKQHHPSDFGMPVIALYELLYGAYKSERIEHNVANVEALKFEVLELDREDGEDAGKIRAHLARKGEPIGPYDVLIAGQARARGLAVVTHNTKEFERVPGLTVVDWTK
ncbi:type II toxin-antitoxin system VapC family toxin [Pararobbsia alpina]|uniref:Ribonuclease VapC n=1 Tax=Pararobbsia alpina TaxID=621374 RepID=A0A6S7AWY6_9BURK|nr:type II toxin-antitoxin system VapC family toxin [Pararobbsia alpina]CAB3780429.1 tRNA(fMet)-specific endonuclease VapC [Pararobbsia alpina]